MKIKQLILDPEEAQILKDYESGEFRSVPNLKKQLKYYQQVAHNSIKKSKNINLRVTEGTFSKLKAKAIAEGLPYQTLASSILHKYAMS